MKISFMKRLLYILAIVLIALLVGYLIFTWGTFVE